MKLFFNRIYIISLIFLTFSSGLFAATNVIDNFNDSVNTNDWILYSYAGATYSNKSEMAVNVRVGSTGHSLRMRGGGSLNAGSGVWMQVDPYKTWQNQNWTSYTNLRFYAWQNGSQLSDPLVIQLLDSHTNIIQWASVPNNQALWGGWAWKGNMWYNLHLQVKPGNTSSGAASAYSTNNDNGYFTRASGSSSFDWTQVKQMQIQVGQAGAAYADFNLDEIAIIGPSLSPSTMLNVRIQPRTNKTWSSDGVSQITFPSGIDTLGPDWTLSDSVIFIQYSISSNHSKLLFYNDNKDISASPKYTGDDLNGGLVGQTQSNVITPLIWSLYDERISDRTNFRTTWSNIYKSNQPLLPSGFNRTFWTNRSGPYISGYWKNIIEINSSAYSWNSIGQYECVIVSTNDADQLGSPQNAPLKGTNNIQYPVINYHGGAWTEYRGPFGGFWANDNYKSDMSKGQDGLSDLVIYLAASFKNKPIQNYKSNRIIIELCYGP